MAVDFTLEGIIQVVAQTFCGGSTVLAGLLVMVAAFFVITVIFAAMRAPLQYALVPMMLLDIVFTAIGVINTTISFIVIVMCSVLMAKQVRDLVGGGSRWVFWAAAEVTTVCRSSSPSSASSSASWSAPCSPSSSLPT